MAKKKTEDIKKALMASHDKPAFGPDDLLSTGSTLLNLALSDNRLGGFVKGTYALLIGASGSGKTFLAGTCFAEAVINPNFDFYRLIFDDAEQGALMDFRKFFGSKVADRVEPPHIYEGEPSYSEEIEDFYFSIFDAIDAAKKPKGRPFIYVLDSLDALSSKAEGKKIGQHRGTRHKKGDAAKVTGDYGDGKAKINSRYIRRVLAGLRETGSILIIINQERDNIGAGLFESSKTHSGGRSLKFYATVQIWADLGTTIKKSVRGQKLPIGVTSKVRVTKNRLTGKDRRISFPIFYDYGIDDLGSCVDFLITYKHWKKVPNTSKIDTGVDFGIEDSREELIGEIEDQEAEEEVLLLVQKIWNEVEKETEIDRKPRYQ